MTNRSVAHPLISLSILLASTAAHATDDLIQIEEAPVVNGHALTAKPVIIVRHEDGTRELLPLEKADEDIADERVSYPFRIPGTPYKLEFMGGIEATSLQGASLAMGVVVGSIEDGMLGHLRAGVLLEATPGTDGFKVGAGYTVGSAQGIGLGLSATYLKSYGRLTVVPQGEDLLGLELNGDFFIGHWILGVMGSLESGTWYANAGAGVRFY